MTMTDGWQLRTFDWTQPPGHPVRGRMLFLTGRADFAEKYLETIAHWHGAGWDVSGFDWRGQGGSFAGDGAVNLDRMLADLHAFVRVWVTAGAGPHVAIAHSMGGHLMLRLLADGMRDINAAVLVAPMLGLNTGRLPAPLAAAIARTARRLGLGARFVWRPGTGAAGRQQRLTTDAARYADELHWSGHVPDFAFRPPRWAWVADAYASIARLNRGGRLESIAVPILLIGTLRDALVDPAAIVAAAARIPTAEVEMRTTGAHELLREADPVRDAVLTRIDTFLDRFGAS